MNHNLYAIESNFIKVPKKKRNFDDDGYTSGNKKKQKKDYSKQRERKRNSYE